MKAKNLILGKIKKYEQTNIQEKEKIFQRFPKWMEYHCLQKFFKMASKTKVDDVFSTAYINLLKYSSDYGGSWTRLWVRMCDWNTT